MDKYELQKRLKKFAWRCVNELTKILSYSRKNSQ